MQTYSLTYLAVFVLTALCTYLGLKVEQTQVQTAVEVIVAIGSGLIALYGRYRAGGITPLGVKK